MFLSYKINILLCTYIEYTTQDTIYNLMFQCQIFISFILRLVYFLFLVYVKDIETKFFMRAH